MSPGKPDLYGVTGLGEGDCEFRVTVATEEHRKNFPMSSIDGFPIRVSVGWFCLLEGADGRQQQQGQEQSRNISCPPPLGDPIDHDTWINSVRTPDGKNIPRGGSTTSKVVTVDFQSTATDTGKGSHVDLKIDNGRYKAVASPKTIRELSVGKHTIYLKGVDKNGNEDPRPAKWTFTVTGGGAGGPETWVNWVRASPRGVNIADGGSTPSSTVIVDFQGTVAGRGSHIDLRIDDGKYKPVASPYTIKRLPDGTHTIYLKAVNQAGKADPTPAKWTLTVGEDDGRIDCLEGADRHQQGCDYPRCPPENCRLVLPDNDTGGPSGGGGSNGSGIDEPPILEEPIPDNENDTTGKRIIGEEALRLPFVMFGDRVSARSLTALSR
jgi:hypothetical protein